MPQQPIARRKKKHLRRKKLAAWRLKQEQATPAEGRKSAAEAKPKPAAKPKPTAKAEPAAKPKPAAKPEPAPVG